MVEMIFDSGDPVAIYVGDPENMRNQSAMRIDPAFATMELQARNAQTDNVLVLFWREIAGQPREPSLGAQTDRNLFATHIWEHGHQPIHDLVAVDYQRRVHR